MPVVCLHRSFLALVVALHLTGCSLALSSESAPQPNVDGGITNSDGVSSVVEIGSSDSGFVSGVCGESPQCDPDRTTICVALPFEFDAGANDVDSSLDSAFDSSPTDTSSDVPTKQACRVFAKGSKYTSACAPAGNGAEFSFCASDAECSAGLACVGVPGRCLPYCCGVYGQSTACDSSKYCTKLARTESPSERIPVWVPLDRCELLGNSDQCAKGAACGIVTNCGATTCVPIGTGREGSICSSDEPCDQGFVCVGPSSQRTCRRLCREGDNSSCVNGAICIKQLSIPSGFGICSGGDAGIP